MRTRKPPPEVYIVLLIIIAALMPILSPDPAIRSIHAREPTATIPGHDPPHGTGLGIAGNGSASVVRVRMHRGKHWRQRPALRRCRHLYDECLGGGAHR